jgi:hypothetical protein
MYMIGGHEFNPTDITARLKSQQRLYPYKEQEVGISGYTGKWPAQTESFPDLIKLGTNNLGLMEFQQHQVLCQ